MDISEAATCLGVSHKSIRRYVKAGRLKVMYVDGKGVYSQSEVEALKLDKQTPVHRVFPVLDEATELSQFVPPEKENQIIQFPQGLEQYYNLQYLQLKLTLTIDEAAVMSGFSKAGLRNAAKSGAMRAIKQGGRWRVRSRDLEQYIEYLFTEADRQLGLSAPQKKSVPVSLSHE